MMLMSFQNFILQSVPVVAQTDTNNTINLGAEVAKDSAIHQLPSIISDQIDSLEQQLSSLESQLENQQLIIWVLVAFFVICAITIFLALRRNMGIRSQTGIVETKMVSQMDKRLFAKVDDLSRQVSALKEKIEVIEQKEATVEKDIKNRLTLLQRNTGNSDVRESNQVVRHDVVHQKESQNLPLQKSSGTSSTKYFSLQEEEGQLFVKERNLKDDSSRSWFRMEISGDTATYDINQHVVSSILEDISTLRLCANDFDPNPSSTAIMTIKPGHLRKEGHSWVVTEKITVKLI